MPIKESKKVLDMTKQSSIEHSLKVSQFLISSMKPFSVKAGKPVNESTSSAGSLANASRPESVDSKLPGQSDRCLNLLVV